MRIVNKIVGFSAIAAGLLFAVNATNQDTQAATAEIKISGVTQVLYRVGGKGYNVRLFNSEGKIQPQALHDGTSWKLFAKKQINGETMYRLGNDNQWIPARYTTGDATTTSPEVQTSGLTFVKYISGYSVRLFNANGAIQAQSVKHGSSYKIFASKTINGELMYRIGSQNQWIPARYTQGRGALLGVPYISQYGAGAPNGCEGASALEALHYKGKLTDYNLQKFLKTMPIAADGNPYHGFNGSPFTTTNYVQTIFPPSFTKWVSKFTKLEDISGQGISAIKKQIDQGNPVVAWVTINFGTPRYTNYSWGRGVTNLHVMTVDGYTNDSIHVSDPVLGKYWVSNAKFNTANKPYGFLVAIN